MIAPLKLDRSLILAFRRRVGALGERLPAGRRSLRRAAWAGLQDSMPRAAVLSIHARVSGTQPDTWEDPSLAQLWGPRYSTYVVPQQDFHVFSLGRFPDAAKGRAVAEGLTARLAPHIRGKRMKQHEVARLLGEHPNRLKYAATTGAVRIRWDGARQPTIWMVKPPSIAASDARTELARRYLHVFGPTTPARFAEWAGISNRAGDLAFESLRRSLTPVSTPIGDAWILSADEPEFRATAGPEAPARLLPSGDAYYLLQGADRELLVPDPRRRASLWTSRVWPGAVLVEGEIVGVWRRADTLVTVTPWRRLPKAVRATVEAEAASLPLPGAEKGIAVRWQV